MNNNQSNVHANDVIPKDDYVISNRSDQPKNVAKKNKANC